MSFFSSAVLPRDTLWQRPPDRRRAQFAEGEAHAIPARLLDLKKEVVTQHVRHPGFNAFTSIKYVGPALVDDLSHGGLAIRNGDAAMLLYEAVAAGRVTADERQRILDDLREHCGTDTMVLVKPLKRFQELAQ